METLNAESKEIIITNPSFEKSWWNDFYEETAGLTKPKVIKNVISQEDLEFFKQCVLRVIKDVSDRKVPNGFRLSIEGAIKDDNRDFFFNNPPTENEDILKWCSRVFGDKKFGVILNSIQNYDRSLKADIFRKFRPLLEEYGVPGNGIEITLFFGNYGYTPLGFHLDPKGHKVTHLHVGPGKKKMFLMTQEKYEDELKLKTGSKDFEKLVPLSEEYEFNETDCFFMPVGYYHVGHTEELSIGLTVWHIEPPVSELQMAISIDLMKKIFSKEDSKTLITKDKNEIDDISHMKQLLADSIDIDADYSKMRLDEAVDQLLIEHRYKIRSNGYFFGFLQNTEHVYEPPLITMGTMIKGCDPFSIKMIERGEKTTLFVQSKKVSVPNHPAIPGIVEKLNGYQSYSIENLFAPVLDDWDADIVLYITQELYRFGGVEVIKT